jgi:hypothetical protein
VRELLKAFTDLAGAVLTIDAMHTQSDTAQVILGRGADYVMTVIISSLNRAVFSVHHGRSGVPG